MRNAIEILKKEPSVKKIILFKQRALPRINKEFFHSKHHEIVQEIQESLHNFIQKPIIADSFENHEERRAWRSRLYVKHSEHKKGLLDFLESNCLRINAISVLYSDVDFLKFIYPGENKKISSKIDEIIQLSSIQKHPVYDLKNMKEKILLAKKFKQQAISLLELLSKNKNKG